MELHINYLIFEVTRRCNMNCTHCLRGDSQRINITEDVINNVLIDIDSIYSVTFSGGEPFLNFKAIDYIFSGLKDRNIEYLNFYLVTNGKIHKKKYIDKLQYEYDILKTMDFTGGLTVSLDEYHDTIKQKNIDLFTNLKFYRTDKDFRKQDLLLINTGRANNNGIGVKNPKYINEISFEYEDDKLWIDELYINALGDVLIDCNLSYDDQTDYSIGNVLQTPFEEIILNQIFKQDPQFKFLNSEQSEYEEEIDIHL